MNEPDAIRLRHMLDAACEAVQYIEGLQRADLDRNRMLAHSLVHCIEIIGEAANKVSQGVRDQIPVLPWGDIIGMRNRLIHAYYDIDLNRVWDTAKDDLPQLIAVLKPIVPDNF